MQVDQTCFSVVCLFSAETSLCLLVNVCFGCVEFISVCTKLDDGPRKSSQKYVFLCEGGCKTET